MYCYYCGYEVKEDKVEQKASSRKPYVDKAPLDAQVKYVCPRCGHLVHEGHDEKDIKSLSAACHAELQRGRNDFARGMSSLSIGVILAAIALIFFLLLNKPEVRSGAIKPTQLAEFWVFLVLTIISVILLVYGAIFFTRGVTRNKKYTKLLKDINTKTFVQ